MLTDTLLLHGSRSPRQDLFWLLLLALVVLGAGLGLRDPWPADEPRFALVAKQMVESGQWLFPMRGGELYPDKPPMLMWLIAFFYSLTGSLKVSFLLPSLLAGLGCVALVYDAARRLWDAATGLRAGLLLLFTVQFTVQAHQAQIDALLTLFVTLGLYGFLRFLACQDGWRWYYLGWFAAGLGIITKGVGIIAALILLPALWTHWQQIRRASLRQWLKALAGPLVMLLAISLWLVPMVLSVAHSGEASHLAYRDNILFRQTVTRYANAWHHVKPFWYYLTSVIPPFWLPLSLLLPWLIWQGAKAVKTGNQAAILLMGYLLAALLFFSCSPGKRGVYMTPLTPALALLAAPWLPLLLARRWPARLFSGLAWLLPSLFLLLVPALLLSHRLDQLTAELAGPAWPLALSLGVTGLLAKLWLRRQPLTGLLAVLSLLWLHYGLWAYPLLNPVRTPADIMAQVEARVPAQDQVLIVDFREQLLLFAGHPVLHYPYAMNDQQQAPNAAVWLKAAPGRWVLGQQARLAGCFDPAKGEALGNRHGDEWLLVRREAITAACPLPDETATPLRYAPTLHY